MKIALLQINPTVGDLSGNARLIADAAHRAAALGADLAVTPELALVGYLPRDLLLDHGFEEGRAVIIEGEGIAAICAEGDIPAGAERVDLNGQILAPGFIDVQVNGGGGHLFNDAPTVDTIAATNPISDAISHAMRADCASRRTSGSAINDIVGGLGMKISRTLLVVSCWTLAPNH